MGRDDHFFELGGHSLLAIQLVARVRRQLGAEVALAELFAQPTLAGLAALIDGAARAQCEVIALADRSAALPLSWSQQRLWVLDQLDHESGAAYHIPAALRLDGQLDRAALQAALDRIVARHENLRTRFVQVDGQPVQVIGDAGIGFALGERDLCHLSGHEQEFAVRQYAIDETALPFDLAQGPLVRGQLLRLAPDQHVLLITQHHIITDGWSMGVLVGEVRDLYRAFQPGLA
ncbi:condensation domain-containing protein [Massilia sp. B-10]|nr:condensation domain-containing protein [Massilia sp. B-10]UUZ56139.1 condensation domain-containing protein [Massilia sp. H-1]